MEEVGRSRVGGRSKKSKKSKKSKDVVCLKESKDVDDGFRFPDLTKKWKKLKDAGDGTRVSGGLKESKDVNGGYNIFDLIMKKPMDAGNGSMGSSLSSTFKRKLSIAESSSLSSSKYFYYPEDCVMMQNMYGLTTESELSRLIHSTRTKHDDIVSPNLCFTYGVEPYNRDSDPRIGSLAKQKEEVLNMVRSTDRPPLKMRSVRRRLPEASSLPTPWRKPELKPVVVPNQEEIWRKSYEEWEAQEDELLHARDLRMATRALACFNLKFKTDYMVEQVLGSQKIDHGMGSHYHCNFIARSKEKGSQKHLFFAELQYAVTVLLCCILDGDDVRRGCRFCGNEFVHPSEEGLLTVGAISDYAC